MKICTIIAKNYPAHARTLSASILEHHPDGECFDLVIEANATPRRFQLIDLKFYLD